MAGFQVSTEAEAVEVEAAGDSGRADLSFIHDGKRYDVELKTCNTNCRMKGVLGRSRPITKNIDGVLIDGTKLRQRPGSGIVAFCLFPVPRADSRWTQYLTRIASGLSLELSESEHSTRVTIPLNDGCDAVEAPLGK